MAINSFTLRGLLHSAPQNQLHEVQAVGLVVGLGGVAHGPGCPTTPPRP